MGLQDQIRDFVDTAQPGASVQARASKASELMNSNAFYIDSGGTLCVRALDASRANLSGAYLPTRISGTANEVLVALRELVAAGVLGARLYDQDPGVRLEVIS